MSDPNPIDLCRSERRTKEKRVSCLCLSRQQSNRWKGNRFHLSSHGFIDRPLHQFEQGLKGKKNLTSMPKPKIGGETCRMASTSVKGRLSCQGIKRIFVAAVDPPSVSRALLGSVWPRYLLATVGPACRRTLSRRFIEVLMQIIRST